MNPIRWNIRIFIFICFITIAFSGPAAAQFRTLNQAAVPENTAVIVSAANLTLHLSYFDSVWKEVSVVPGATLGLPCKNGAVSIAFSDGASTRRMSLAERTRYALFWDDGQRRWDIESYDSLFGQETGLRPN